MRSITVECLEIFYCTMRNKERKGNTVISNHSNMPNTNKHVQTEHKKQWDTKRYYVAKVHHLSAIRKKFKDQFIWEQLAGYWKRHWKEAMYCL